MTGWNMLPSTEFKENKTAFNLSKIETELCNLYGRRITLFGSPFVTKNNVRNYDNHYKILKYICSNVGKTSRTQIIEKLDMRSPSLSNAIDKLELFGLVTTTRGFRSGRDSKEGGCPDVLVTPTSVAKVIINRWEKQKR